ncbi:ABC transporter ATP-binding protein [Cohnella thailandensis]|uniref:ABC transporter ATP-binding protein n=1 Tax=Cohnella thailandensis TaxID=557557 RepID=A0A841T2D9_9BACL|nr:ABC transporter ATP-binding protein [Cohnella thailandensis]MBB6636775.1 ABC transporter ATP-binding protein [Cohnella thailandensis]MBP1973348.1 ATP-binding cassette subfamily B protein [Cohnella thailandensis]
MSRQFQYQDDELIEKAFNWKQMGRLFTFVKPYRSDVNRVVFVMMVFGMLTKLAIPFLISLAIDRAINPEDGAGDKGLLFGIMGIMLAMYLLRWWAQRYTIMKTNEIGQKVIFDLRNTLFKHIQSLSFRFFDKRPAGSVLVRVTNDVNSLQDLFTNGVVNSAIDIAQLFGIIIILLTLNFKLGLAVMITVPLMFIVSTSLRKKIRFAWQTVRIKQSRINSHLNESIQGIRVTQAFAQENENIGFFDGMNRSNIRSWNFASALNQLFGPVIEITSAAGTLILLLYGTHLIRSDEMTVGVLVAFITYVSYFWEPITRLGQMYSQLLISMSSAERIFEYLDEKPVVAEKEGAIELPAARGEVVFDNVEFGYEPDRPALRGINLHIEPGMTVALVGHTGSGKSTIVNLLCRFYDTVQGSVRIDGVDVRDIKLDNLRTQTGIVMQDTFIFSGTIRDNIRYGRPDATDAEVEAAARSVRAHEFIVNLPNGYDTEVQERGSALSMGQRQLLSFARALLADPRILIMDEATASIDTETELRIQDALRTLLADRTSFIVAHRLSTIRHADLIVVLDHGVIIEQGNHEQLMKLGGHYRSLIDAQYRFLSA